ncbi:MAG: hypothetical protein ACH37Z_15530 [Anaerolineae bacterium]|nr:hypothetical protein [Ardenticatenia bacterium]HQZ71664.1 hypothetical protein [Anaerolineae bacterium]HRA19202.1 hypothetical protein [Anaerolineae bacterium]
MTSRPGFNTPALRASMALSGRLLVALGLAGVAWLLRPTAAQAQQTGNFCVEDGPGGVGSCSANDGGLSRFVASSVTDPCVNTSGDTGTAVFAIDITTGSPTRYDYGFFVDLSGSATGALDGDNCYHDYLPNPVATASPPGPPYRNIDTDACGDAAGNQTWTRVTQSVTFTCADRNNDNRYDMHVCVAYDNNAGTTCNGVGDAYPGTGAKCQCFQFDVFGPLAVDLTNLRAEVSGGGMPLQGAMIALLLGAAFIGVVGTRRRPV